jgi:multicomponent Na+:H+ antiporter subunit E
MNIALLNLLLAFGWCAVTGSFTLANLIAGFVIGYATLWIARPLLGPSAYFERLWAILRLAIYFHYELVVSSLRVLWDVVTPPIYSRPGIIAVPIEAKTDLEILLLANLVSLTPGTLSLDISEDRRVLYVHAMFADDPEEVRRAIKDGMERRVLEAVR